MTRLIRVEYGRVDVLAAIGCNYCRGRGQKDTRGNPGVFKTCWHCKGTGRDENKREVGYAYACPEPVQPGDIVLVPPTDLNPSPSEATVIGLGTSYGGEVSQVIRVVERVYPRPKLGAPASKPPAPKKKRTQAQQAKWERQKRKAEKRKRDRELAKAYGTNPGAGNRAPKPEREKRSPTPQPIGRKLAKQLRKLAEAPIGSPKRARLAAELDRQGVKTSKSVRAVPTAFESDRRKH